MMSINKNKIAIVLILIFSFIITNSNSVYADKKADILDSNDDVSTKIAIVTESKENEKTKYDTAEAIQQNKEYLRRKNISKVATIEHLTLPDDFDKNRNSTEAFFKKIEADKDVNVVIFTANKKGLIPYVEKLKKSRKDLLLISVDLPDDDNLLIKTFQLNFKSGSSDRGEKIASLAKSLGAERFFTFLVEGNSNEKIVEDIKNKSKELGMPYEEILIPKNLTEPEKKAFVSDKIDVLTDKYGKNINFYSTSREIDEVLINKLGDKGYIISELSKPNSTSLIMELFGLNQITRLTYDYFTLNAQISALSKSYYGIERLVGSAGADVDSFILTFSTELGINLHAKKKDIKTAYNSYFLEKIASIRCNIYSKFGNKYSGVGNFKIVEPDQVVY